ncbi:MAG: hypothetical protein GX660_16975, partial [Clostridiaceae bacterium]|nr:hypothetical protein [Clostridiaceae bacterium]
MRTQTRKVFEAVGEDGTVLRTGTMEWDKISPLTDGKYSDFYMYKNSGGYIAVGGGYRNPLGYASRKFASIFISSDGIAWESVDPGVEGILRSVVYDKGKYVVVGDNGVIITSEDGETWEKQNSGIESNLLDIASNGSNFIAEGENGILLASQDGINWTRVYEDLNVSFYELIWDGMRFAAAASYRTESYGYISAIVA